MNFDPSPAEENWWSRSAGIREILQVALPMVLSSLSWTILTFVDRIFLIWHSEASLAASFPASLLWWASMCLPLGICMYVSTFVAQYAGAAKYRAIGPIVWQGIWLAIALTPIPLVVVLFAVPIFSASGHTPEVVGDEIIYFRLLALGTPAMLISQSMSCFYSGRSLTWVVMLVDFASAVINIGLDYVLIFGMGSIPALGIAGAAWATSIAIWCKVFIYAMCMFRKPLRLQFAILQTQLNFSLLRRLLTFGGPSGLQMLLDVSGFTFFVMLVGSLGTMELAATTLAFNVSSIAFMPVFGLSIAATILVGKYQGETRPDLASRATWNTMAIGLIYMGIISAMYVLTPDLFLFSFFADDEMVNRELIHQWAVVLLRYVAIYNLFDALNLIFSGALKGAGDTRFILIVSCLAAAVLASGTWLAVDRFHARLNGCWGLITVWVCLLGLIYSARFQAGNWKTMSVIENDSA
jgi:MATE family multidrug resistance protein